MKKIASWEFEPLERWHKDRTLTEGTNWRLFNMKSVHKLNADDWDLDWRRRIGSYGDKRTWKLRSLIVYSIGNKIHLKMFPEVKYCWLRPTWRKKTNRRRRHKELKNERNRTLQYFQAFLAPHGSDNENRSDDFLLTWCSKWKNSRLGFSLEKTRQL